MKKKFYSPVLIVAIFILHSATCFAQGIGNHLTMILDNCSMPSANTIQFDVYAISDGYASSDLRADAFQVGINYNTGIL